MLAIRLQRTGRRGHAQYRMIVQDSRFSPTRGRVVSYLGSYDPHTKVVAIDSQKAVKYLENGAQPSDRVAKLLQKEGIKLPDWVHLSEPRQRTVRNPDKRRSTRPEAPAETAAPEAPAAENEEPAEAEDTTEESAEVTADADPANEEKPAEPAAEALDEPEKS